MEIAEFGSSSSAQQVSGRRGMPGSRFPTLAIAAAIALHKTQAPLFKLAAIGLIVVGLGQMLGYAADWPRLELIGKMTGAAPLPLVFDLVDGVEYWALRHELQIVAPERTIEMRSTPELFSRIRGPHIVKIAYILPLALAPVLPDEFRDALLRRAFCGHGKLARDFELPAGISEIRLTVAHPRGHGIWRFVVECPR